MLLNKNGKKEMLNEIDFIISKMDESQLLTEKLYYFSAMHGVFNNSNHPKMDPIFRFASFILKSVLDMLTQRLAALRTGESTIPLGETHFEKILQLSLSLYKSIKTDNEVEFTEIIKEFLYLGLATTGRDYYLNQKSMAMDK